MESAPAYNTYSRPEKDAADILKPQQKVLTGEKKFSRNCLSELKAGVTDNETVVIDKENIDPNVGDRNNAPKSGKKKVALESTAKPSLSSAKKGFSASKSNGKSTIAIFNDIEQGTDTTPIPAAVSTRKKKGSASSSSAAEGSKSRSTRSSSRIAKSLVAAIYEETTTTTFTAAPDATAGGGGGECMEVVVDAIGEEQETESIISSTTIKSSSAGFSEAYSFSSSSPSFIAQSSSSSSVESEVYIDSEWDGSSMHDHDDDTRSNRSSGGGRTSASSAMSSLAWGTPYRNSMGSATAADAAADAAAEAQTEREGEGEDVGGANASANPNASPNVNVVMAVPSRRDRRGKRGLPLTITKSDRDSIGSACSELSIASDAETVALRPSGASDLSTLSPGGMEMPAPGTPGAKLLARGVHTPMSGYKTGGGKACGGGGSTVKKGLSAHPTPTSLFKVRMSALPSSPQAEPEKEGEANVSLSPVVEQDRSSRKRHGTPDVDGSNDNDVEKEKEEGKQSMVDVMDMTAELDGTQQQQPGAQSKRKKALEHAAKLTNNDVRSYFRPVSEPVPVPTEEEVQVVKATEKFIAVSANCKSTLVAEAADLSEEQLEEAVQRAKPMLSQALSVYREGASSSSSSFSASTLKAAGLAPNYSPADFLLVAATAFLLSDPASTSATELEQVQTREALAALAPYLVCDITASSSSTTPRGGSSAGGTALPSRSSGRRAAAAQASVKKSVCFSNDDGSCVSPPNDRRPASWASTFAASKRLYQLITHVDTLRQQHPNAAAALLLASRHFICENEDDKDCITTTKSAVQNFFLAFLQSHPGSMVDNAECVPRAFEVSKIASLMHGELILSSNINSSSAFVSELRHRASWMASSVARFAVRWLYDDVPFSISTPSAAGPPVIPHCRSNIYKDLRLESRENARLQELCWEEGGEGARQLPRMLDMDPSEMTISSLVSCALRQVDKARALLTRSGSSNTVADLLASAIDKIEGESEDDEDVDEYVADVTQVCLAAEYAREFLLQLFSTEIAAAVASSSSPSSSTALPLPRGSSHDYPGAGDVWEVLSTCGETLGALGDGDDHYLAAFAGGVPALRNAMATPLLEAQDIARAQRRFRSILAVGHEKARVAAMERRAHRAALIEKRNKKLASRGDALLVVPVPEKEPRPAFCWDLCHVGLVLDFPIIVSFEEEEEE